MRKHHEQGVEVTTRQGVQRVCPHCGKTLTKKEIYIDSKNWHFCRACFRKGHGAIRIDPPETKVAFLFEYELPPDPEEFDLSLEAESETGVTPSEKRGQYGRSSWGQASPGAGGYPWSRARNYQSQSPQESHKKQLDALNTSGIQRNLVPESWPGGLQTPDVLLPALGLTGGLLLAEDSKPKPRSLEELLLPPGQEPEAPKSRGALRGLLTGLGAAAGQRLAGAYTQGDNGSRIAGGLSGGVLAYLLARDLL